MENTDRLHLRLPAEARWRWRGAAALAGRTIAIWVARARQRRDRAQLDDRLLRDVGISRAAAAREARKPFWRG